MAKQLLDLSTPKEIEKICEAFVNFSTATLSVPIKILGTSYGRGIKVHMNIYFYDDYNCFKVIGWVMSGSDAGQGAFD